MPRFRMLIEYDGSDYCGWQIQADCKTVQGQIQDALAVIQNKPCMIVGAGRTDTGVHARGQVAHFNLDDEPDLNRLKRSLNGILNSDIRIKDIIPAGDEFHARFDAIWRIYLYQIATQPQALIRNQSWYYDVNPDLDKMNLACLKIQGENNFKSFCRTISDVKNHFCTVKSASWVRQNELIIFRIEANRFLHGMVRSLVGTMIDIGRGKISVDDFINILHAGKREEASQSAPARGLILDEIVY